MCIVHKFFCVEPLKALAARPIFPKGIFSRNIKLIQIFFLRKQPISLPKAKVVLEKRFFLQILARMGVKIPNSRWNPCCIRQIRNFDNFGLKFPKLFKGPIERLQIS